MEHSSSDISNHRDNTIIIDIRPFTTINVNSTVSFVNENFVSVQHFTLSKPSLTTPNPELVSNFKNVMDESSVPPTISPLHLLIFLLLVFYLTTFHKKKWKHYIHLLTLGHR